MKQFFYNHVVKFYVYLTVIFTPILPSLLWLGFFVAMDLITALIKCRKVGEPITSKKLSGTITKMFLYFSAIICSHILDTQFLAVDFLPVKITQLVAGFIAVVEFKSVIENISEILGMPLWQFIKSKVYREEK